MSHPILSQHFYSTGAANASNPTYRLPSEVLTRIFGHIRHFYDSRIEYRGRRSLEWIVVTHVSRHWRNVAISSPSLWSNLSTSYHEDNLVEWFQRSEAAPLSIDFRYPTVMQAEQYMTAQLSRIKRLALVVMSESSLAGRLSSPAPLLESFSVMNTDMRLSGRLTTPPITDLLFAGITPRLQELVLRRCSIDINSPIFTDLTRLDLSCPSKRVPLINLLSTLRRLPRLTSLILLDVADRVTTPVDLNIEVISLSALESLNIAGISITQDLLLLRHLSFPQSTTLQFKSQTRTPEGPVVAFCDFLRIQNAARQGPSPSLPSVITRLRLGCALNGIQLSLSDDTASQGHPLFRPVPVIDLYLLGDLHGEPVELLDQPEVLTTFSYLDLQGLTSVKISCPIGPGIWRTVFGRLPHLKCINVVGDTGANFFEAIMDDVQETCPAIVGNTSIAASTLSRMRVALPLEVSWDPIFSSLEKLDLLRSYIPDHENLITSLYVRGIFGKRIQSLEIRLCREVDEDLVDELREVVDRVGWDGWMGPRGLEYEYAYNDFEGDDMIQVPPMFGVGMPTLEQLRERGVSRL